MKVIALNGSPRKKWNTATLLKNALDGAASRGAETELVHLYDYSYKGCISCFACKLEEGRSYGRCAVRDELTPILDRAHEAGALILGSPIYFGMPTGVMRSFVERLLFQYLTYDAAYSSKFKRKIPTGWIYTMNVDQSRMEAMGYGQTLMLTEMAFKRCFGAAETLLVTDTYQFDDYSKFETSGLDEQRKARRRAEVFPEDCRKAFDMGVRFAEPCNT
ncbi:MAG: flavodoxin family protein [Deltaproteobacteria bacterium]|nr:flavodoxin family protein [Deltaproteobacteria bacterium]